MLKEIQALIAEGKLKQALARLKELSNPVELSPTDLLEYFRLLRRTGAFELALLRLQRLGIVRPELEVERAILIGELGASAEALRILRKIEDKAQGAAQVSLYFHLGNLYSLEHRYAESLKAFAAMKRFAEKDSLQSRIATLNVLGTQVYLKEDVAAELDRFDREELEGKLPLLSQGAKYFLSVAHLGGGNLPAARRHLSSALELGMIHRVRENLLLTLTRLHLDLLEGNGASEEQIEKIRQEVLAQSHVVYFDQLESLLALRANADPEALSRHQCRLLFGGRDNLHTRYGLSIGTARELPAYWEVDAKGQVTPLTRKDLDRRKVRPLDLAAFKGKELHSLVNEPGSFRKVVDALSRRLEFGMNQGELWEQAWQQPFQFQSSPTAIRQTIKRIRSSGLKAAMDIECTDRRVWLRLSMKFSGGTRYITLANRE